MQKQDFFSKQPKKADFSGGVIRNPQKKKSWTWIRIVIILLIWGVGYLMKNKLFNPSLPIPAVENGYTVGNPIEKEGKLTADGDLLTYTHTLTTADGEKFLLKSSTISLNNYTIMTGDIFKIEGTIEAIYQGQALVEVKTIEKNNSSKSETDSPSENSEETTNPGVYLNQAGIWFPSNFFDQYAFVGEAGENSKISIKNLDNEKITTINYFTCTSQGDTNCKELIRTFEGLSAKKVTTLNGDTFYKLPEEKTRFFQNGNRRGYFINNAEDEEVEKIKNLIIIANAELIKNVVNQYGVKTCLGADATTESITNHTATKTSDGLKITMEGKGEKTFTCEAMLDLSKPTKLKFLDLKVKETAQTAEPTETGSKNNETTTSKSETKVEQKKEESTNTSKETSNANKLPTTPNVKQFPVNLEKTMSLSSSRGEYTIVFPSPNIAYSIDSADEDFGQAGVRCNYATRVIQYTDEENLQSSPSVIIYECSFKKDFTLPGDNYLLKEFGNKKFVIEVKNPARFDFAKQISIEKL